ncbi:hypothetical protein GCM10010211_64830 [Streptomyces albospinus]|uniref:Cytochrome aa3 subunit 3 n=1 Tax=Streptomyces albospinus TaxID=285515 RepID=A0ABQ2VKZ5_9ACTN|nr:hypothetical protein GCM10010211_64830 [Streptomyces albospinus]
MATVTYAHHSLIQGNRKGTINGLIITIILALIFTSLQGFEYYTAPFTISDGAFGSTFYFATGFHGYNICPNLFTKTNKSSADPIAKINIKEWLSGFTDAEGNFNITLRKKQIDAKTNQISSYSNASLTFQIGLHIDDLNVLKTIQTYLNCGKISISKNRCNYFVNDITSLQNIIVPFFNENKLKSSKFSQFLILAKAVDLFSLKAHLLIKNKPLLISYYNEIKSQIELPCNINITDSWLLGFIEGDASFSTSNLRPRLKFENHIKEMELIKAIKEKMGTGSLIENKKRSIARGFNENPTVVLDIANISFLYNIICFKFKPNDFLSKKKLDYIDWMIIVKLNYFGYHLTDKGRMLIMRLKSGMNNYRLSSSKLEKIINPILCEEIDLVFNLAAPYKIVDGVRVNVITNKKISDQKFKAK